MEIEKGSTHNEMHTQDIVASAADGIHKEAEYFVYSYSEFSHSVWINLIVWEMQAIIQS